MHEIEICVCVDTEGQYGLGTDAASAAEAYHQDFSDPSGLRCYCLKLSVPSPDPVELSGTVPAEGGEVRLTAATVV